MLKRLLPVIVLLAATSLQAAEAPPVQVASPHFTVITDAGEKEARRILDNFERMRWVFQTLFPKANVDPATPIVVIAMKNRKGFQALEPPAYLAKNQLNLAGLFMKTQDMNYMLLRLDAEFEHPYSSVYHEYTHLQYSSAQEWMPLWLFEGIAEFFQNTDIHSKDAEVGEPNPNDIFFLRQNALIPLETLFRVDPSSPYYHEEDKGSIFYAESWALTHYLIMSDRIAHTDHLGEYLKLVSQNADPVAAATQAFGDLKSLKTALGYYIAQGQLKQFVMNSGTAIDESAYKVTPLTHNAFDVARAGFLVDVGRTKDAQALLEAVLQTDPKDAGAHETMGFLEFREGDRVAARKWYGEALQLDSQSYLAHFYFAMLSLGDRGSESAKIESNLRASIQIKPDFAPGYDQLAAYLGQKHKDLDEAQKLNLKAVQLDRSNLGYRINAANLMEERDRWDEAQKVLESCLKTRPQPRRYRHGPEPPGAARRHAQICLCATAKYGRASWFGSDRDGRIVCEWCPTQAHHRRPGHPTQASRRIPHRPKAHHPRLHPQRQVRIPLNHGLASGSSRQTGHQISAQAGREDSQALHRQLLQTRSLRPRLRTQERDERLHRHRRHESPGPVRRQLRQNRGRSGRRNRAAKVTRGDFG